LHKNPAGDREEDSGQSATWLRGREVSPSISLHTSGGERGHCVYRTGFHGERGRPACTSRRPAGLMNGGWFLVLPNARGETPHAARETHALPGIVHRLKDTRNVYKIILAETSVNPARNHTSGADASASMRLRTNGGERRHCVYRTGFHGERGRPACTSRRPAGLMNGGWFLVLPHARGETPHAARETRALPGVVHWLKDTRNVYKLMLGEASLLWTSSTNRCVCPTCGVRRP
jgi:hypothetical protein